MATVPPVPLRKYQVAPYIPDGGVPVAGLLLTILFSFGVLPGDRGTGLRTPRSAALAAPHHG